RGLPQVVEDEVPCGIVDDDLAVLVLRDSGDPADTSPVIEVGLCDVLGVEPEPLFDLGEEPVLLQIRKRSEALRVDGLEGRVPSPSRTASFMCLSVRAIRCLLGVGCRLGSFEGDGRVDEFGGYVGGRGSAGGVLAHCPAAEAFGAVEAVAVR